MANTVIRVENVSKQYRLGSIGTGSISHDLNRWWHKMLGHEDPYLEIGEVNDRTLRSRSNYVWALQSISFEVEHGAVVGIIGRNGAGKSTLLKLLSRTTLPTRGNIKVKGRMASLLEVGTGFHPELSGRENIFLNGAILGMTKAEIRKKFDEIVDFAGVEKYIDTPVKRYSSGMYVRLAFAVAAHLDPEILIVDEVLAVGDLEFQKKALGRMQHVSKAEGRTVLFVSHNIAAVQQLCSTCIVLNQGTKVFDGQVSDGIKFYSNQNQNSDLSTVFKKREIKYSPIEILEGAIVDTDGMSKSQFEASEEVFIRLKCAKNESVPGIQGYLLIRAFSDEIYIESDTHDFPPNVLDELSVGEHELLLKIPARVLPRGKFKVYLNFTSIFSVKGHNLDSPQDILTFEVHDTSTKRGPNRQAYTNAIIEWKKVW